MFICLYMYIYSLASFWLTCSSQVQVRYKSVVAPIMLKRA